MEKKKKLVIMSASVEPELPKILDIAAQKGGFSRSELIRELVHRHLDLVVNDGEEIPVILRVPSSLKGDREGLQEWFAKRTAGIVETLAKAPKDA